MDFDPSCSGSFVSGNVQTGSPRSPFASTTYSMGSNLAVKKRSTGGS